MNDETPITVPPVKVLREQLIMKQAEVRRLRKLLLLAKAVNSEDTALSLSLDGVAAGRASP